MHRFFVWHIRLVIRCFAILAAAAIFPQSVDAQNQITDSFDSAADAASWYGTYQASGGSPGGFLSSNYDGGFGSIVALPSPSPMNFSPYYGGLLSFDMTLVSEPPTQNVRVMLTNGINSNNGIGYVADSIGTATGNWTHYSIPIIGASFGQNKSAMISALDGAIFLTIGSYSPGTDAIGIDNFSLQTGTRTDPPTSGRVRRRATHSYRHPVARAVSRSIPMRGSAAVGTTRQLRPAIRIP